MPTHFLITSDLHQHIAKWQQLVRAVQKRRPRFVLIAGDLLPKEKGFGGQKRFFPVMAEYLRAMRGDSETTVLLFLGNDDFHPLEPHLDHLAEQRLCVNLNERIHREAGWVFCGVNRVRDYPFAYKHWCVPDGDFVVSPIQLRGEGITVDEQGNRIPLENLREHLLAKPSLEDRLQSLKSRLSADEIRRSIWMVHNPPARLGMDICYGGQEVGSPNLLKFMEQTQPFLGCSGHIHESPHQPGGQWMARVGKTFWYQAGQDGEQLHSVDVEVSDSGDIISSRHSIFGEIRFEE